MCFDDCGRLFVICVVHFDLLWFGGVLLIVLFLRLFDMCMCIGLLILFIVLYALFGCGSL